MPDLKIEGRGPSFFAELFATDIGPGKQFRELTKNAFEAIAEYKATHPKDADYDPRVEAFVDPYTFDQTGATKWAISDNGCGMSHEIMSKLYLIFHSGKTQSLEENYGIGARASTLKFNPEGVEFRSWRNGKGYVCTLAKLREEHGIPIYGTLDDEILDKNGDVIRVQSVIPIEKPYFSDDEIALMKPPFIRDHGTVVVLHGKNEDDDTTVMPEELRDEIGADGRSREHTAYWQTHLYNAQYFEIPEDIKFRLYVEQTGKNQPERKLKNVFHGGRQARVIHGTKHFLTKFSERAGTVDISGAKVHWWILGESDEIAEPEVLDSETQRPLTNAEVRKRNRVWYPWLTGTKNHAVVSAIHRDEQFDLATKVDAVRMLQGFGIFAGHDTICIVVEPDPELGVRSNMNRTSLMVNKRKLPWDRWGHEFAQRYPKEAPELLAYIQMKLGSTDFDSELDRLLAEMKDDFTVPTFSRGRARKTSDDEDTEGVIKPRGPRRAPDPDKPKKPRPEPDPNREIRPRNSPQGRRRYRVIDTGEGSGIRKQNEPRPSVKLLTEDEHNFAFNGRAAEYVREATSVHPSGIIYINRDFDVMEHLVQETLVQYFSDPSTHPQAESAVRGIVELVYTAQILFTVMTYRASFLLGHGSQWSEEEAKKLVSPESLTAIVLARPGMREQIKRRINSNAQMRLLMMQQQAADSA